MKDMKAIRDDLATAYELCSGPVGFKNGFDSASAIYEEREKVLRDVIEKMKIGLEFYSNRNNWKVAEETPDRPIYKFIEDDGAGAGYIGRSTLAETAKLLEAIE